MALLSILNKRRDGNSCNLSHSVLNRSAFADAMERQTDGKKEKERRWNCYSIWRLFHIVTVYKSLYAYYIVRRNAPCSFLVSVLLI